MPSLSFTRNAWEDYIYWQTQDRRTLARINKLIAVIVRDPDDGIGKPEALSGDLTGCWSRRIDDKHRLIYQILENGNIEINACRSHYGDR
jgi:toxin YoeB